jgi:hypothetical protein
MREVMAAVQPPTNTDATGAPLPRTCFAAFPPSGRSISSSTTSPSMISLSSLMRTPIALRNACRIPACVRGRVLECAGIDWVIAVSAAAYICQEVVTHLRKRLRLAHLQAEDFARRHHCKWRLFTQRLCHAHGNRCLAWVGRGWGRGWLQRSDAYGAVTLPRQSPSPTHQCRADQPTTPRGRQFSPPGSCLI